MQRTEMPQPRDLLPNQIFVFGSDSRGHHAAGTAGIAMRGDWRENEASDEAFLHALQTRGPGEWTEYGHVQGPSKGRSGKSYAVQTTAGTSRSVPLEDGSVWEQGRGKWLTLLPDLKTQIERLCAFAQEKPDLEFLVPELGTGASGYTEEDWDRLWAQFDPPANLKFIALTE